MNKHQSKSTPKLFKHTSKVQKLSKRPLFTKKQRKTNKSTHHSQTSSFSTDALNQTTQNPATVQSMNRPGTSLYRDCLRLIDYMAGKSRKSDRLREIIRGEFNKNKSETDLTKVEQMKASAVQGLANYLTIESLARSGNKYTAPGAHIQQDQSHFNKRRNLQQASNNLSLEELQALEREGPQEYAGVRVTPDFQEQGIDMSGVSKDDKPQFVKDLVDSKSQV